MRSDARRQLHGQQIRSEGGASQPDKEHAVPTGPVSEMGLDGGGGGVGKPARLHLAYGSAFRHQSAPNPPITAHETSCCPSYIHAHHPTLKTRTANFTYSTLSPPARLASSADNKSKSTSPCLPAPSSPHRTIAPLQRPV
jgi:hypothetical protein